MSHVNKVQLEPATNISFMHGYPAIAWLIWLLAGSPYVAFLGNAIKGRESFGK